MRYLSNSQLEQCAAKLLKSWSEAEGTSALVFPVDVEHLATDFLGIEVKFGSLDKGTIAEFRVSDEVFVLDRECNRNRSRARFSIAHEIGHLELHSALRKSTFCRASDSSRQELQANRFAAALLMPAADLVEIVAEEAAGLGKFSRKAAEADIVAACSWLRNLLRGEPLKAQSLKAIVVRFGVSLQSLNVRLIQLHVVSP
jgi:Zn-dependent peptidase ImmA (M78 family)